LIGCWISDPLNNWFGRRGEIFITSIILILTPIGSGFSQNWYQLFAIRLVLGIGMGAKAATVPMYAAELSPAVVRGALVMGWQLWTAFGIFIGTCANAVVKDVSPLPTSRVALTPRSQESHGDSSLDPLSSPPCPLLLVSTFAQSLLDGT
jgi:MFS family permease